MSSSSSLRIIASSPFSPNISKTFYLCVFIVSLFVPLFVGVLPIFKRLLANVYGSSFWPFDWIAPMVLVVLLLVGLITFFCHMLRLYVSIEELENPFSTFHKEYICALSDKQRKWEGRLRILLFALVSLKIFDLITGILPKVLVPDGQESIYLPLRQASLYLSAIFCVMLFWDLLMWRAGKDFNKTFAKESIPGLLVFLILFFLSPSLGKTSELGEIAKVAVWVVIAWYVIRMFSSLQKSEFGFGQLFDTVKHHFVCLSRPSYCGMPFTVREVLQRDDALVTRPGCPWSGPVVDINLERIPPAPLPSTDK